MTTFDHNAVSNTFYLLESRDGHTWRYPYGAPAPYVQVPAAGGVGSSSNSQASSLLHRNGAYWLAYEISVFSGAQTVFGIAKATKVQGPYQWVADVTVLPGVGWVWCPRWFVDDDNTVHILVDAHTLAGTGGQPDSQKLYIVDALDETFTSWSAATLLTGTGFAQSMIDPWMLKKSESPSGLYVCWYKNDTTKYVEYMSSSSLKTGWTITKSGDWMGIGTYEGPILKNFGTFWRLYIDNYTNNGATGTKYHFADSFDNWATWSALAPVTAPIFPGTGSFIIEG